MTDVHLLPFSDKVNRRIVCCDALQFFEGPVRSGKTQASLMSLLYYIQTRPVSTVIMSGNTVGSLVRNCIDSRLGFKDLCPRCKKVKKDNVDQILVPTDHGVVRIYLFGAGKANSDDQLRGVTADAWYADEITKHHLTFVAEAMARIAASDHPFMVWTSNPENPNLPLYREYTDKYLRMTPEEKERFGGYHEFHFELTDNPIMTERKIEALKSRYSGHDYDRKILGKRCVAEGLVYPRVDRTFFRDFDKDEVDVRYCAIDFGTDHPTVMLFGGMVRGNRKDWRIVEEYFDEKSDKTTYDHYIGFLDKCRKLGVDPNRIIIAIDPAANVLRKEFLRHGLSVIRAKNAVIDGIEFTKSVIYSGILSFHTDVLDLMDEFGTYSWDPKASEHGEDRPIKQHDDRMDTLKYFSATHIKPIIGGSIE